MDKAELIERAKNAREIAYPIASEVDWYTDDSGEINSVHNGGEVSTEQRMAVIAYVIAGDVLRLAHENGALGSMLADCVQMLKIMGVDDIPDDITAALAAREKAR